MHHRAADDDAIPTERLILRPHRPTDLDAYAPLWLAGADEPAFTPRLDREGAWARLLRLVGHRQVFGFAPWVVEERTSGRIVGEVGLARFHRGLGARFDEAAEAMWIVAHEVRGLGHGREAMAAAIGDFDRRFPGGRSVCMIDPENAVSLRLAEGLGFRPYDRAMRHGRELVLFERVGAGTGG